MFLFILSLNYRSQENSFHRVKFGDVIQYCIKESSYQMGLGIVKENGI